VDIYKHAAYACQHLRHCHRLLSPWAAASTPGDMASRTASNEDVTRKDIGRLVSRWHL